MIQYDVVFHRTVVNFLLSRPSRERRQFVQFFDGLSNDPFQTGEFEITDVTGRQLQVRRIGGARVTFWSDHAVKEVHITDIERVR